MKLDDLFSSLNSIQVYSRPDNFDVRGVSCDSKKVFNDFVFVAVRGASLDGHKFVKEALDNGARALIVDISRMHSVVHMLSQERLHNISVAGVNDSRLALADLAAAFYGWPSRDMKIVGITGTNGKTTVSYLIEAILEQDKRNTAVIGTINYRFNDQVIPSRNTTPGSVDIQFMLKQMLEQGVAYVVMEVSSHALAQDRIRGIGFRSGIFTNLTQDHLDYHGDIENYFLTKAKLFESLSPDATAIINGDDAYARKLAKLIKGRVITYGIRYNVDVLAKEIKFDFTHTEFVLRYSGKEIPLQTSLIGRHNVYNILASIAFSIYEGIDLAVIKEAIAQFKSVPGRLERIDTGRDFYCFVDYAHTEDALRNVIMTLREVSKKKIIVVFGCGGERDKTKRPKMGRVVSELADYAIIANDNPRSEDPEDIINDIKSGIGNDNYSVIPDRRDAISKSLSMASSGDVVLIAGKGHEPYQIMKNEVMQFDDREVARECLK